MVQTSGFPDIEERSTCLRIIQALKAGRAPREGVRFLSVGVEELVKTMQAAFAQALQQEAQFFWLTGDYGEGKSHLLRLIAALAHEHNLVMAYVTHEKDQLVGLHKPARLLHRILWELQWGYPQLDLRPLEYFMDNPPAQDRWVRSYLPKALKDLTNCLHRQRIGGLVVCIDEIENCRRFYWNQHYPAVETLHHLLYESEGPIVFCLGLTVSGLESLRSLWKCYVGDKATAILDEIRARAISAPALVKAHTIPLTERIFRLHSVAFDWQPTVCVDEVAEKAWRLAQSTPSGRWRVFVQSVVAQLEIAHQRAQAHQMSLLMEVAKPLPTLDEISPLIVPLEVLPSPKPSTVPFSSAPSPWQLPSAEPIASSSPSLSPEPVSSPQSPISSEPVVPSVLLTSTESHTSSTLSPSPEPNLSPPLPEPTSPPSSPEPSPTATPKIPRPHTFQVGDRVMIARGTLRGWYGTVLRIRGKEVEIALEGIRIIHLWYPVNALKRLKKRKR